MKKQIKSRLMEFSLVLMLQIILMLPFYSATAYALSITNIKVTQVTASSATVQWNTDTASNGKVKYGSTSSLGYTQRHDNLLQTHSLTLTNGLNSETKYYFAVESTDANSITAVNNNSNSFYTFTTLDITPPQQVAPLTKDSAGTNYIAVSWSTVSAPDFNHYAVYIDHQWVANTTSTAFNATGLSQAASFNIKVAAVDNSNNEGAQSDSLIASTIVQDSETPIISNVNTMPITDTSSKVTWETNEDSSSTVFYGISKTNLAKTATGLSKSHSVTLDALVKDTKYTFAANSCDASNNCINSSGEFIAGKDDTPPFINLTIPRYYNREVIDLIGSTEPYSTLKVFVNNMNQPSKSFTSAELASGRFSVTQVQLARDNQIKIEVLDKANNPNEKTFDITVDTIKPIIALNRLPNITTNSTIKISGTASEPVVIKVFLDANVNDSRVPAKIIGLNATKIGQNSVEMEWKESGDNDFSHYAVYRDNVPIAIIKPANFNLFVDALVDTGKKYTYKISSVNTLGKEGAKSNALEVTTLTGGSVLGLSYPAIDPLEDFRKPFMEVNATNSFSFPLRLTKGDGDYKIKLIFEDAAGNDVIFERTSELDTKNPTIKIVSPQNGAFVYENVAGGIDIVGKTEPNARVYVYINRAPLSAYDVSVQVSGVPNEIASSSEARLDADIKLVTNNLQNLSEASLDSKCKSAGCIGADYTVDSDSGGNFKIENVDLASLFSIGGRIRQVSPSQIRDVELNQEARDSRSTSIIAIATDRAGKRGIDVSKVKIGNCWSGNQSWDVIPLTQYQSPTFMSTERMREGTESLYFYFNYSYIGRGTNAHIKTISMTKACGTTDIIDPRFNLSCKVMPSGNVPFLLNKPENDVSYSAMLLSRFSQTDSFVDNDWKNFLGLNGEMTFPFKLRITYEHEILKDDGTVQKVTETQTTCEQVGYVLDKNLIDPRKVLPDFLLNDFADFLQDSTKTLTEVQNQIDKVIDYVAIGCMASFFGNTVAKVYRMWSEFKDQKLPSIADGCPSAVADIIKNRGFKISSLSDADLKTCLPGTASAWATEAKMYQLHRWSCDRIFGHSAPSKWTESVPDEDLTKKIDTQQSCSSDGDTKGKGIYAEDCRKLIDTVFKGVNKEAYNPGDKCFDVSEGSSRSMYQLGSKVDNTDNVYQLNYVPGSGSRIEVSYAIRQSDRNFLIAQQKTCAQLCGEDTTKQYEEKTIGGEKYIVQEGKFVKPGDKIETNTLRLGACITVNQCREWNANSKNGGIQLPDGRSITEYTVTRQGYGNGCFYDGDPSAVDPTNANTRQECCCIKGKDAGNSPNPYYEPSEVESKSSPGNAASNEGDMKWSYRYARINYLNKKYNPNRYIEGRDLPACFGMDSLLHEALGRKEEVLILDPFKQHTAAMQCLFLTGINQRLQMFKNVMTSMSNCLVTVRETGRSDVGVCKELFTQHVCDVVWQGVNFFVNPGCGTEETGFSMGGREDEVTDSLRLGFKSIASGISKTQQEIMQEYPTTQIGTLLGTGGESVSRKICLGAFGYDWALNTRNLIDAAYSAPFATLVQPVTKSREFLTVDPLTLKPKYEYSASWFINPGCDLENYKVELACVSRKEMDEYPNSIKCSDVGGGSILDVVPAGTSEGYSSCDCLELPQEVAQQFISQPKLKQNVPVDMSYRKVIDANYRYDHLKFTLRTDRKIPANIQPSCFPTGYEKGVFYASILDKTAHDITDCTIQPTSGVMSCGGANAFFSRKGTVQLIGVTLNEIDAEKAPGKTVEARIGENLVVSAKVTKTGLGKCMRVSLSPDPVEPQYVPIDVDGTSDVSATFPGLSIYGTAGNTVARYLKINSLIQSNEHIVSIKINITDNNETINGRPNPGIGTYTSDDYVTIDDAKVSLIDGSVQNNNNENLKITVDGNTIRVEKDGASFTITGVTYQNVDKRFEAVETMIINPQQQGSTTSQKKTVKIEVFNMKEGVESYNDVNDCNINDVALPVKSYYVMVSQRGATADQITPVPANPVWSPTSPTVGQEMTIKITIRNSQNVERAEIELVGADQIPYNDVMQQLENGQYEYRFIPSTAGIYNNNINAIDKDGKPHNKQFTFTAREQR